MVTDTTDSPGPIAQDPVPTAPRPDLLASLAPLVRALRRIEDRAAAEAELSMWQYAILTVVEREPDLNQGEVAQRLAYSANRIIADLDLLEERRLVTRRPGPDRRAKLLRTTPAGVSVMRAVQTEIHRGEDELLARLLPARSDELRDVAAALGVAFRAAPR